MLTPLWHNQHLNVLVKLMQPMQPALAPQEMTCPLTMMILLNHWGDAEALELVEFNPTVELEGEWTPPQPVLAYLQKHFTKSLDQAELDKIVKEFPKPQCSFLETHDQC